ncbi:MAG: RluA family pseudouridine synthase, partial [Pyrinomonadaceae bacterium]
PEESDVGKRLDIFLADKIEGWSRARLKKLITEGDVLVNSSESKPSYKIRKDDVIEVELTELPATSFKPEAIPIEIVFEDEFLAVVNKPSGMVVHPGAGVHSGTLANAIAWHFNLENVDGSNRVGIVHRLDKETSGLMVVAKSQEVQEKLSAQFQNREVFKQYIALVHGAVEQESGKIDAPIGRDRKNRLKMKVTTQGGRSALSFWRVLRRYEKFTLLEVEPKTGRTHQIRVHLAYIGHPIVGDRLYNSGRDKTVANQQIKQAIAKLNRFFLHSARLEFNHPVTGRRLSFSCDLPAELSEFLSFLQKATLTVS